MTDARFLVAGRSVVLPLFLLSLSVAVATGCGSTPVTATAVAASQRSAPLAGKVFGGQQPVMGASIQLYAVGAPASGGGYGQGAVPLLTGVLPVTDANGSFSITGDYTAPSTASHFYIVASGGSATAGNPSDPDLLLMAALGGCTATVGLSPTLYISINEVTTMASIAALQPFMAAPSAANRDAPMIGAPSSALNDLQNAFETVNTLVNTSTGQAVLPANNWATTTDNALRMNTLGNILATCINSNPGDGPCASLYTDATPSGQTFAPTDTGQAAWYIAQNPTNNVPLLFNLVAPTAPFVGLTSAPADFSYSVATSGSACQSNVNLGTAANFVVLATSTITSTGMTTVSGGNLGLSPGTTVTGFPPAILTGTMDVTDTAAALAESDLMAAYNTTRALAGGALLPADFSALTLPPGLYTTATTGLLSTTLTLDAQGDPNAVFLFQIGTALTVGAGAQVTLINGAQAKNVYWTTGTAASLAANGSFVGTIMAGTAVSLAEGATLNGRALATNGAVTLVDNAVTAP